MKKARLIFTKTCDKACKGCCMDNWVFDAPSHIAMEELSEYDEIYITGGEPMLFVEELKELIGSVRTPTNTIFLYTALVDNKEDFLSVLDLLDGVSVTLHSKEDVRKFKKLGYDEMNFPGKKMRLNVFPRGVFDVTIDWDFRPKIWIKDCPLPSEETLVSLREFRDTKLEHLKEHELVT